MASLSSRAVTAGPPPAAQPQCANPFCAKKDVILRCTRCRGAIYCSAACQQTDWPAHKRCCMHLPPSAVSVAHTDGLSTLPQPPPLSIDLYDLDVAARVFAYACEPRTAAATAALRAAVAAKLRAGARVDVLVYDGTSLRSAMPLLWNLRLFDLLQLAGECAADPPLRLNCFYPVTHTRWKVSAEQAASATGLQGSPSWRTPLGGLLADVCRMTADPGDDLAAFEAALRWLAAAGADFALPAVLDGENGAVGAPLPRWTDPSGRYRLPNVAYPLHVLNNTASTFVSREEAQQAAAARTAADLRAREVRGAQALTRITHLVPVLAELGADVSAPDCPVGMTPLHHACFASRVNYAPEGCAAVVAALIAAGADPDATDSLSRRPIDIAAFRGEIDAVAQLLTASAARAMALDGAPSVTANARAAAARPRWYLSLVGRPRTYLMAAIDADCADVLRAAAARGVVLRDHTVPLLGLGHLPLLAYAALRRSTSCTAYLLSLKRAQAVDVNEIFPVRRLPPGVAFRVDCCTAEKTNSNVELGTVATCEDAAGFTLLLPPDGGSVPMTVLQLAHYYPKRFVVPAEDDNGAGARAFHTRGDAVARALQLMGAATVTQLQPDTDAAAQAHEAQRRAVAVVLGDA
jgi:hypothetical protein